MRLSEGKLKVRITHFRLPSASQKRVCLSYLIFAPERSEGVNDAKIDTNKLYAQQKSFDYHYYQYTRPNRKKSFNKQKMFYRDVA